MRNLKLLLLFSTICITSYAQNSNFDKGFKVGFSKGYCYTSKATSNWYCNPPLPPIAPLPDYLRERSDSYDDGYNRGFLVGRARRDKDDYKSTEPPASSSFPKFNPYVPQIPILRFSPEERELYYASRAAQQQAQAEALGKLLEMIFSPRELTETQKLNKRMAEQEKARRIGLRIDKLKNKNKEIEQKKMKHQFEKDAKRLVVGSEQFLKCKSIQKRWLFLAVTASTGAVFSYLKGYDYALKYNTATIDAGAIKRKANVLYQIAPICAAAAGISIIEVSLKNSKIKKAKPKVLTMQTNFSNYSSGLSLAINL
jgi:hypothetical protein